MQKRPLPTSFDIRDAASARQFERLLAEAIEAREFYVAALKGEAGGDGLAAHDANVAFFHTSLDRWRAQQAGPP